MSASITVAVRSINLRAILFFTFIAAFLAFPFITSCARQPRASRLAADISKLGFIPGKPVKLPKNFKAECSYNTITPEYRVFRFAEGFFIVDSSNADALSQLVLFSPSSFFNKNIFQNDPARPDSAQKIVGAEVPASERSSIQLRAPDGNDIFTLSKDEIIKAYGPPSLDWENGLAFEYIFVVGKDSYESVRFIFEKQKDNSSSLSAISLLKFRPSIKHPLGSLKIYRWPGLRAEPG